MFYVSPQNTWSVVGGLDKVTTNQKFYRINSADGGLENITEVFQKYQII